MNLAPGNLSLMYRLIIALVDFPVTSSRELGASFKGSEELCSTQLDISTQRAHLDTVEAQTLLKNK